MPHHHRLHQRSTRHSRLARSASRKSKARRIFKLRLPAVSAPKVLTAQTIALQTPFRGYASCTTTFAPAARATSAVASVEPSSTTTPRDHAESSVPPHHPQSRSASSLAGTSAATRGCDSELGCTAPLAAFHARTRRLRRRLHQLQTPTTEICVSLPCVAIAPPPTMRSWASAQRHLPRNNPALSALTGAQRRIISDSLVGFVPKKSA